MEIFEPEATGRNSVARERKELPEIGWCQNDRNFGAFAAVHSDFSVEGPKRGVFGPFLGLRGSGVNFFSEYGHVGYPERRHVIPGLFVTFSNARDPLRGSKRPKVKPEFQMN